jgi:enoyl-CoA hydratase
VSHLNFEHRGGVSWAILDRPAALNALTLSMIDGLSAWLGAAVADRNTVALGIRAAGNGAFSAGGDVRSLYEAGQRNDRAALHEFYRREYRLNRAIHIAKKPFIALIDGLVMGGGAGVSMNGRYRVVGSKAQFAMPETGIGFFPDVGASWFLSRCPGRIGVYLGLTGARLGAADMLWAGLATHFHGSGQPLADLGELERLPHEAGPAALAALQPSIDRCFTAANIEGILLALDSEGSDWAKATATELRRKSPTALKVALRQLHQASALTFGEAMIVEYRLARHFMAGHDFFEGVRAAVIDKDRIPVWRPASLTEVDDETVDAFFAPAPGPELDFD